MNILITIPYASKNYSGGINVQCRMWKEGLEKLGHHVHLHNCWERFDYKSIDIVLIVGNGKLLPDYISLFKDFSHIKFVSAPIIDEVNIFKYKLRSNIPFWHRPGVTNVPNILTKTKGYFSLWLARSEWEKRFICEGHGVNPNSVEIVPISMRFDKVSDVDFSKKEDYCLHVSRLASPGKNVERLVLAAKKYNFKLVLAGTINGDKETAWLESIIGHNKNITYTGWVSEEELKNLYKRAKVFALPSFIEGVGMAALEAACYGCDIVLTNIGAPKEYYNGRAVLVNPNSIDSIGEGVIEAMTKKNIQPELKSHIENNYSVDVCIKKLEQSLSKIL